MSDKIKEIFAKIHNYSVLVSSGVETSSATRAVFGENLAKEVEEIDAEIEKLRNKVKHNQ